MSKRIKFFSLVMAVILCFSPLVACSGNSEDPSSDSSNSTTDHSNEVEVVMKTEPEMEQILLNSGWDVQNTTAASFHLWEQMNPQFLLLAENTTDHVLIAAQFDSIAMALKAYESTVPESNETIEVQDSDIYKQSLVPMEDGSGFWLFRQAGPYLLGAWMPTKEEEAEFENIFNSFQVSPEPVPVEDPNQAEVAPASDDGQAAANAKTQ